MDGLRPQKRQKNLSDCSLKIPPREKSLNELLIDLDWGAATLIVNKHPELAAVSGDPSPLALVCRFGAPVECVKVILSACPERLRHVVDARGTPLHEAVVCENVGADIISCLLKADEALGTASARAALLQDVDGFTPLHLLIRRRFQKDVLRDDGLLEILELLVKSCPSAVVIPDRGEFEEPPIVYALKANQYAPLVGTEDDMAARVERRIYEMVDCMLQHYPEAASRVFTGYRGQYTALHSAVFHGRMPDTVELLLTTEAKFPSSNQKAGLLMNTQGEMPLHFCAMRGESPRSLVLLAKAAPGAVLQHEASGLTPTHWLWVRYVNSLLSLDDGGRGDITLELEMTKRISTKSNSYNEFSSLEQGEFTSDLHLIRRLDPPVDYLRMRHIPVEFLGEKDSLRWATRTVNLLKHIRARYYRHLNEITYNTNENDQDQPTRQIQANRKVLTWTRREVVVSLFWTKIESLLQAANMADEKQPRGDSVLVHTAFAGSCCIPAVARIVASLFPEEMSRRDGRGRLPLHYAACRNWHRWDWPLEEGSNESPASRFLRLESLSLIRTAIELSPPRAARVADNEMRLPLHHVIDTFVQTCCRRSWSHVDSTIQNMLIVLQKLVKMYPEALQRRDGVSKLYPFMHATAIATDCGNPSNGIPHDLSISYILLRENPTLLKSWK